MLSNKHLKLGIMNYTIFFLDLALLTHNLMLPYIRIITSNIYKIQRVYNIFSGIIRHTCHERYDIINNIL